MTHFETQSEWEEKMGNKILDYIRGEVYLDLPFLDVALSALIPEKNPGLKNLATDGVMLYYNPEQMIPVFKSNELFLKRAFLHTVFHCLYAHLWIGQGRDRRAWNLACDIFTENLIDQLDKPCTKRILSWSRQQFYEKMKAEDAVSAAGIYRILMGEYVSCGEGYSYSTEFQNLEREFFTDDHAYWPDPDTEDPAKSPQEKQARDNWQQIARQTAMKREQSGKDPDEGERILMAQIQAEKSRRSYGDFLKKFAVLHEELHQDPDEFDLNFYTYGLQVYGNLPLIEPLETKEEKRILEFVIVVDTSYSTSGELVEGFLRETFSILKQKKAFSGNSKIHLIQCDEQVQSDVEIVREEQIEPLLHQFTLKGGGNTDFRPAFTYVNQLREEGKLKNLGGLLYFTDGRGIYPVKKPDYRTAFLFLNDYEEEKVPAWAMRMKLDPEEIKENQ